MAGRAHLRLHAELPAATGNQRPAVTGGRDDSRSDPGPPRPEGFLGDRRVLTAQGHGGHGGLLLRFGKARAF